MKALTSRLIFAAAAFALAAVAIADGHDPREVRDNLMEKVGKAAKPVGQMLRGDREFSAEELMTSLETWQKVSMQFGDLFPEGSETGMDTEAAPAIWEDRDGFNAALTDWQDAVAAAIEAAPQSLEDARPVVGPVFNPCQGCHDGYRSDEDE